MSNRTILLYEFSFLKFEGALDSLADIKQRTVELRTAGMKPVTLNTYLRHIKTFYKWKGMEWKIPWLKEEEVILPTLSADHVRAIELFKPRGVNQIRARLVTLTILDTGLRISETLGLKKEDIDFDQLSIKVLGKGSKYRLVPFSPELRKVLFRHVARPATTASNLIFGTKNNTQVTSRNFLRDFKELGKSCGISGVRFSPHTLRHTFAVMYLRKGGNLEYLRRILGHKSILTTQKYLKSLGVDDLVKNHGNYSPLGK